MTISILITIWKVKKGKEALALDLDLDLELPFTLAAIGFMR